ncbi:MAG: DUF3054 domain-containing protein [Dehalococcoidia bacterium]
MKGHATHLTGLKTALALLPGDILIFTIFALLGLVSHGETITPMGIVRNVAPLAVVWLPLGALAGVFRAGAVRNPRWAWVWALGAWLPIGFLGMVVRSLWLQRPLWTPALLLFLAGIAVLLMVWRSIFSLLGARLWARRAI